MQKDDRGEGLLLGPEVYRIVGAAMEVANQLGAGFLAAVYQEALEIELAARGIPFEAQKGIAITYKGRVLEKGYIADLVCYGEVIVEVKSIKALTRTEEAQLLNYLKATGLPVGVLINFGTPQLQWKRYISKWRGQ